MGSGIVRCTYPCKDTNHDFIYPGFNGNVNDISVIMISESPSANQSDYFYESNDGAFFRNTRIAFKDAGIDIQSYDDLTRLGIYLTTAIKCSKTGYLVSSKTIRECAFRYLQSEIFSFKNVKVIMCMGDFAIKAVNYIYKNRYNLYPIKQGATYKIRNEEHVYDGIRFIPSYTQTGDSFNIEQSKRKMIAEDIKTAIEIVKGISRYE